MEYTKDAVGGGEILERFVIRMSAARTLVRCDQSGPTVRGRDPGAGSGPIRRA